MPQPSALSVTDFQPQLFSSSTFFILWFCNTLFYSFPKTYSAFHPILTFYRFVCFFLKAEFMFISSCRRVEESPWLG